MRLPSWYPWNINHLHSMGHFLNRLGQFAKKFGNFEKLKFKIITNHYCLQEFIFQVQQDKVRTSARYVYK
jgi:hypothetical protein